MVPIAQPDVRNRLLRRLAPEDYALLAPHMERFRCDRAEFLFRRGEPLTHAYFLDAGIGSVVATSPEGRSVEAGLFGREGFAPTALALGADRTPFDGTIQVPDQGWRIPAAPFRRAVDGSEGLRRLLLAFIDALSVQSSFTALSNAVHTADERLARWLLMCHDRVDGDDLPLTHEFLSLMLAVRRPGVAGALRVLEGEGLIRAERGRITVRDRAGLEAFAGDAYGIPEETYRRLIGPLD